jgi:hypothetical protein
METVQHQLGARPATARGPSSRRGSLPVKWVWRSSSRGAVQCTQCHMPCCSLLPIPGILLPKPSVMQAGKPTGSWHTARGHGGLLAQRLRGLRGREEGVCRHRLSQQQQRQQQHGGRACGACGRAVPALRAQPDPRVLEAPHALVARMADGRQRHPRPWEGGEGAPCMLAGKRTPQCPASRKRQACNMCRAACRSSSLVGAPLGRPWHARWRGSGRSST